ncbi:hypothetical protein C8J57DRAFT_1466501 [Mycena rebaudengoi]|nr:hypothetical protein C8J57DRAFT_1466501 [Mycena rebaudengoi]
MSPDFRSITERLRMSGKSSSACKFVHLIHDEYTMWPNLKPDKELKVGAYGHINRDTGEWESDGNVYDDEATAAIAVSYPRIFGPAVARSCQKFQSWNDSIPHFSGGPDFNVPGIAALRATVNFSFSKKKSAAIFIAEFLRISMPDTLLKLLCEINPEKLRAKSLVTEVLSCGTCFMKFGQSEEFEVTVDFGAEFPIVSFAPVGGGVSFGSQKKKSSEFGGLFPFTPDRALVYFPLFTLKRPSEDGSKWKTRGTEEQVQHDWVMQMTPPEWGDLDDDSDNSEQEHEADHSSIPGDRPRFAFKRAEKETEFGLKAALGDSDDS